MKPLTRYKIKVEDESHLNDVISAHTTLPGIIFFGLGIFLASIIVAGCLLAFTPLRNLLPGYLKASQRSATEEGLMRLDSLMAVYERNQAFIDNAFRVTDTDRNPSDSVSVKPVSREFNSDSLMGATPLEQRFVSQMEEREKFNISVLAPLAADGLLFSPVCSEGIFTEETQKETESVIVMPRNSNIQSAADGTVVALYYSAPLHGYVIVIQHGRGFVTSYTHTGTPLVSVGDIVNSGQAIALAPAPDPKDLRTISVRMWHNGSPLLPYDYLGLPMNTDTRKALPYEAPRGRL